MKKLKITLYGIIIVATVSILLFCFQRKHEKRYKKTIPYNEEMCEYFEQESGLNENEDFINWKGEQLEE